MNDRAALQAPAEADGKRFVMRICVYGEQPLLLPYHPDQTPEMTQILRETWSRLEESFPFSVSVKDTVSGIIHFIGGKLREPL